ncbi:ribonuclease R family protein [Helicobacter typhlonius]|uniref:ribonuclease R family protein n=1 Tax=Helicobacter typhlonius TaxID=76936 RepID=UPI002FDF29A6
MIYFYALIANSTRLCRIPKSFTSALEHCRELGILEERDNIISLKPNLLIGVIDVSPTHRYFLKSLNNTHSEDFLIEQNKRISRAKKGVKKKKDIQPPLALAKNDIVLAKITKKGKARFISVLYRAKPFAIATLTEKGGKIQAYELHTQACIPLKVSQKSLRALPPQCVVKVEKASGDIVEVFGVLNDARIDEYIALDTAKSTNFSAESLQTAGAFGDEVCANMYPHRVNLSHLPFCVIDPENARDHDDAIYFDGKTRTLYVAIADVSEYVSIESSLDKEARERGFSLYFPHKVLPMLPFDLSSGICSLKQDCLRLAMVWQIKLDKNAQICESNLFEALISAKANVSYGCVEVFLHENNIFTQSYADSQHSLESALSTTARTSRKTKQKSALPKEIQKWLLAYMPYVQKLKAQRLQKGYEFHTKDITLELDDMGQVRDVRVLKHTLAHSIIEESMLLANKESAKMLESNAPKALFRIHPQPKRTKALLCELEDLGFTLPPTKQLHEIISTLQAECDESLRETFDSLLIKSLSKATYNTHNIGHFGLGFECYTHFTSPIRRYSDIIVHRILKAILHKQKNIDFLTRDLEIISTMLNAQEKHFTHIEHKFFMLKMCRLCEELLAKGRIITQGIVIDELSHCIALEKLPQAKITLDCSLKRFSRVNIEIVDVDLAKGSIYARVI